MLSTIAGHAPAQAAWPNQPIRLVVPFPAGAGTDYFARLVAPGMGEALGQPVIVDNRPGASGIIGATAVANQMPADGAETVKWRNVIKERGIKAE